MLKYNKNSVLQNICCEYNLSSCKLSKIVQIQTNGANISNERVYVSETITDSIKSWCKDVINVLSGMFGAKIILRYDWVPNKYVLIQQ